MNESMNTNQEIGLLDVLKVLKSRIKNILCITLAALLIGGLAGGVFALINNATYGAKAQFYITSDKSNEYIISLLRSDSFAESLLLDENGLDPNKAGTDDYNAVLAIKKEADELMLDKEKKEIELAKCPNRIANAQRIYQAAQAEYEAICATIYIDNGSIDTARLNEAKLLRDNARTAYEASMSESETLGEAIDDLTVLIKEKKEEIKKATDSHLIEFRQDKNNIDNIAKIKDSLIYQYAESENSHSQLALTVKVAVKFDKELAEKIVPKMNENLPEFVDDSIIPEKDEQKPECTIISLAGEVGSADYKNPITQAITFGIIALIAGFVLSTAGYAVFDLFIKAPIAKQKEEKLEEIEAE